MGMGVRSFKDMAQAFNDSDGSQYREEEHELTPIYTNKNATFLNGADPQEAGTPLTYRIERLGMAAKKRKRRKKEMRC
jgi:hypothetical protein